MCTNVSWKMPSRPLLVTALYSFLGFMLLGILLVHKGDREGQLSLKSLRKAIADLQEDGCLLDGHQLSLGDHLAWGFEHGQDGVPRSCSFCQCDLQSPDEPAEPKCFIESCSSGLRCRPDADTHEPVHPCCEVCGSPRQPPTQTASPELQPLAIDPTVPYTRAIYNTSFRHLPASLCRDSPAVLLVVTSIPAAAARRALLRRLYQTDAAAHRIQLVFLLGRPGAVRHAFNDFSDYDFEFVSPEDEARAMQKRETLAREQAARAPATQRAVDAEAAAFGDVIQSDVPEHYFHLSLKTLSLLDAVRRRCPRLRFVAKTDDDVLITVRRLAAETAALNATRAIYGSLQEREGAGREPGGWYSSEREWPWPTYPAFVLGPGYLISGDAAGDLYRRALRARYHHLEDVFVTGVVAAAAGVARRHWPGLCGNHLTGANVCQAARCVFTHKVDLDRWGASLEHVLNASQRFDIDELCKPT